MLCFIKILFVVNAHQYIYLFFKAYECSYATGPAIERHRNLSESSGSRHKNYPDSRSRRNTISAADTPRRRKGSGSKNSQRKGSLMKQTSLPVDTYIGKGESSITNDSNSQTKKSDASVSEKSGDTSSVVTSAKSNSILPESTNDVQNVVDSDVKAETKVNVKVDEAFKASNISISINISCEGKEKFDASCKNSIECEKELADNVSSDTPTGNEKSIGCEKELSETLNTDAPGANKVRIGCEKECTAVISIETLEGDENSAESKQELAEIESTETLKGNEECVESEKEFAETVSNETLEGMETVNNDREYEKVPALNPVLAENSHDDKHSKHDSSTLCSVKNESSEKVPISGSADVPPVSCSNTEVPLENTEKGEKDNSSEESEPKNLLSKDEESQSSSGVISH